MSQPNDIEKILTTDPQWYRKIWSLDIQDMAWVEQTTRQVDFTCQSLQLQGHERILDLACGFGRHALEFARRGYEVVGVDITPAYIDEAKKRATEQGLSAEFICADLRELQYHDEFDVVLNMADGAIGYLENDVENLKLFDIIASALRPGGKHLMDICNGAYAVKYFPKRHWVVGRQSISLADFTWDSETSRMFYGGLDLKFGEPLVKPEKFYANPTRLYNLQELAVLFQQRGMEIVQAVSDFDMQTSVTEDTFQMQVISRKLR